MWLLTSLLACNVGVSCDEYAATSVSITVEDDTGAPIDDATVEYAVDDGPFEPCERYDLQSSWFCGIEEAGSFVIQVDWNGVTDTVELEVEADACHVIPQSHTFVLSPS